MKTQDDFLAIDKHRLDVECEGQPLLYMEYSRKLADAKSKLDEAQAFLQVTAAELAHKVRSKPEKFGIDKITESALHAKVLTMTEHQEAQESVRQAKHRVDILSGAVTAIEHRKRSLTLLVNLHIQGYFAATPPARGNVEKMREEDKGRVRRLGQKKAEKSWRDEDEDEEED